MNHTNIYNIALPLLRKNKKEIKKREIKTERKERDILLGSDLEEGGGDI